MQGTDHWLKLFYDQIDEHRWFTHKHRLLLAVSGGLDSMVLCDLIHRRYPKMAVAHCNFGLRGAESDQDEQFVKDYCRKMGITCFVKHFDAASHSASQGISIQMAAREMRYAWFNSLCGPEGFERILTAHHAEDQTETFFIQLIRRAGIKAMGGMEAYRHPIVRPLLGISKSVLLNYAQVMKLSWREDSSNASDKYLRNSIRLNVLPTLRNIRPEIDEDVHQSMAFLREANDTITTLIQHTVLPKILSRPLGFEQMDFNKAAYVLQEESLFFYLMQTRGFNRSQSDQMRQSLLEKRSGKEFKSAEYTAFTDRGSIWLLHNNIEPPELLKISETGTYTWGVYNINIAKEDAPISEHQLESVVFDADKLSFPLILSSLEKGMHMIPRGFGKKRLLSDILTDAKIPLAIKPFLPVLRDASGKVIWVQGQRPDDGSAPDASTKSFISISAWERIV